MIKSLIVPLLFGTLVVGIAGHGDDMKRVGKLALRSLFYFEVVTTLALLVRLLAREHRAPGRGSEPRRPRRAAPSWRGRSTSFGKLIEHMVPQSFFDAAAKNEVLQIVFFSIIFAVALSQVHGPARRFTLLCCEASRGDVQVHGHRDDVRAARHWWRDRDDRRQERTRRSREPRGAWFSRSTSR